MVTSWAGPLPSDEASPRGPCAVGVVFLGEALRAVHRPRSTPNSTLRLLIEKMNQSGRCSAGSRPHVHDPTAPKDTGVDGI